MSFRKTVAILDRQALIHNLQKVQQLSGDRFFCPMIKADAYGHGAIEVAHTLSHHGVKNFGVALVEEGLELRRAGLTKENIFLFGVFDSAAAPIVLEHQLIPVLSRMDQIIALETLLPPHRQYPVHIKFNTGMNRLGFDVNSASALQNFFLKSSRLQLQGVCTHLINSDDIDQIDGWTAKQRQYFLTATQYFTSFCPQLHIYNSAGLLKGHYPEGARPGISLYGECPEFAIQPVMTLQSEIVMIHHLRPGETVSYGASWQAARPSWVATVAIGYADGLPRRLSNVGNMLYRGQRVPIVGRVCMDYTMLDLTDVAHHEIPRLGEAVVIFGQQQGAFLTASEISQQLATIPYEIFVGVSHRVPREWRQ